MSNSRRKMQRSKRKKGPTIQLQNPVRAHFESFIVGNAFAVEAAMHDALQVAAPNAAEKLEPYFGLVALHEALTTNQPTAPAMTSVASFRDACESANVHHMVRPDSATGQHIVIAGAGPSLSDYLHVCEQADQVWACNSALPYLLAKGIKVTHGFTVDQTPAMLTEWATAPDVEYLVATTIHPHLTALLQGRNRRLRWFHNYVGVDKPAVSWPDEDGVMQSASYEDWLYLTLYPPGCRAGSGLNTVTRAMDMAGFVGASKVSVLGADCALRVTSKRPAGAILGTPAYDKWLRESTQMHADGGNALASGASAVTVEGEIDGRVWLSKFDLCISAVWMEMMRRRDPERFIFKGDTLPNALRDKPVSFLKRLPGLSDSNGKVMLPDFKAAA